MLITLLQWVASIGSILGNIGVVKKKLWGMQVWTIATALWIIYAIITKTHSQLIMFTFYEVLNLMGWIKWRKEV